MVYKIIHDKENCIGCGACAAMDSKNWKMNDEGKSELKGSKDVDGKQQKEISKSELENYRKTAESCPVNVIHIYKDDKKIV